MTHRTILRAGILAAVAAVMVTDGSAEARCRSRRAGRTVNRGCCETTNYGVNTPMMGNPYVSPQPTCGSCSANTTSAVFDSHMPSSYSTTLGGTGTQYYRHQYSTQYNATKPNNVSQPNTTNSVGRPAYDSQNVTSPAAPAPQPEIGVNESTVAPAVNTRGTPSTDPDSDERKASKNPGTAPTESTAPAANAKP